MAVQEDRWIYAEVIDGQLMFGCGDTWELPSPRPKWYTVDNREPLTLDQMMDELAALKKEMMKSSS